MLSRDQLYHRILYLIPDAKFSFWPDEGRNGKNDKGVENPILIGEWAINWLSENSKPCPTEQELMAITQQDLDADIEAKRKSVRNEDKKKDLAIIAGYEIEKKSNPDLDFSDYLDYLEAKSKE